MDHKLMYLTTKTNKMKNKDLNMQVLDLLDSTGLNWTVKQEPLISAVDGHETKSFGLFRKDTGDYLSTVGNRYKVYQNYELAEALVEATSEIDLEVTRGGMLNKGAKVYLQAELPTAFIGKSDMRRWVTGLNSHDGTSAIGFGSTGTVVVCQNTWYMAYGDLSRFRHGVSASERILTFVKGLKKAMTLDEQLVEKMQIMATATIKDEILAQVMGKILDVDMDANVDTLSTRKRGIVKEVGKAITEELILEGETLWGLFNGITRYTNHVAVKADKRNEYIMAGRGYEMNRVAFLTIENWMKEQGLLVPELVTV
jgi:phage/plasmid-like protein (TIGR03299 family)